MSKTKSKPAAKPPVIVLLPAGCPALLSRDQLCQALGVSYRTLSAMLAAGEFPPADCMVGKFRRWRPDTLGAWIDRKTGKGV